MKKDLKDKTLIVFDLDGTLAQSKSVMDAEMSRLITKLLESRKVVVIGGGGYPLFKRQLISQLRASKELLKKLYLFPATATTFYCYSSGWKKMYGLHLNKKEKADIKDAFKESFKEIGYVHPKKTYGKVIEDRGTQVTFSALGQEVVSMLGKRGVALKDKWKRENTPLKLKLAKTLQRHLPKLEVRAAGHTSIDITRKGIDKAYGIKQIEKHLHVRRKNMLFVGDALFPGGNDYAVKRTGVKCIPVEGPEDTKKIIRSLVAA